MFTIRAPAKVNLALEVLGKRSDDYHEIISVVQAVDLCDELRVELSDGLEITSENLAVPDDENLVLRAARALRQESLCRKGARIHLVKRIPVGTGLGGGSSDAAAALWALNHLWSCDLPDSKLARLAEALGSDVPFFLSGGTALVEGRGERITPLPRMSPRWLVIEAPPAELPNKTATLYRALTPADYSSGDSVRQLAKQLSQGERPAEQLLTNAFDRVADEVFPGLPERRQMLSEAGAQAVHLSGSGPALYTLEHSVESAMRISRRLQAVGVPALIARTSGGRFCETALHPPEEQEWRVGRENTS